MADDFVHDIYPLMQTQPIRPHPSNVREERRRRKQPKEREEKEEHRGKKKKRFIDKVSISSQTKDSLPAKRPSKNREKDNFDLDDINKRIDIRI